MKRGTSGSKLGLANRGKIVAKNVVKWHRNETDIGAKIVAKNVTQLARERARINK